MIAILAPGQGAQKTGMLTPWLEQPKNKELIAYWSNYANVDLLHLGITASETEIMDTKNTQPLLVAAALLGFLELKSKINISPNTIIAGHSIGEIAAAGIAGIIDFETAIKLAAIRGAAMARAGEEISTKSDGDSTGMVALLGGEEKYVLDKLNELDLYPANFNAKGQIVAAGKKTKIEILMANPPAGVRVRKLNVAAAFHTKFMQSAQQEVSNFVTTITISEPKYPVLSNQDGSIVTSGKNMLEKIVHQIVSPVYWNKCMAQLSAAGVTTTIELPPAGVLTNIIKRDIPTINRIALKTPADLVSINT